MRHLHEVTADALAMLAHAQPHHLAHDATLAANAPRIHAPPRERTAKERSGQLTCTDLIGPFKPSKFKGNRLGALFLDMHQGTSNVRFIASKDKFPTALRSYLVRNQGNYDCDLAGGALYSDNEIVLNSEKGSLVLKDFEMYHTNSCEYEPWQNPTKRHMPTLQEPMRGMHERGSAGKEYWEYSMMQASLISN
eukprot:3139190-Pleurochrysis_carterae.AAC.3